MLSIPFLLLYWSFFQSFFNNWTSAGLYFYYLFNIDGIFGIYAVVIICLIFIFVEKPMKASRLREISTYIMGLYFILAIYNSLVYESWYGNLELFILPILRISTILLLSFLINRALTIMDWKRYLFLGAAVILPMVIVFIPVMYVLHMSIAAVIISILLLAVSSAIYFLESKGRLFI